MNCAAFAAPGSNAVMDLTGRRIKKVERKLQLSSLTRWVDGVLASVFEKWAVRSLEKMAVRYTDDAIWFKGVAAEAWDDNLDVRNNVNALTSRLEITKGKLLTFRNEMLKIQQFPGATRDIRDACGHVIFSVVDLFDAIEAFKWTLMELEANYSPRIKGYCAETPEGVAELFKRIKQEA